MAARDNKHLGLISANSFQKEHGSVRLSSHLARKTSVFLVFDYGGDYDGKNNKKTHQEKQYKFAVKVLSFLTKEHVNMQIGYIRVSKSDVSQVLDLQHDALLSAGIDPKRIYKDPPDARTTVRACRPV